ncbi:hypothetical protein E4U54_008791 [Claviceps lovelessii]|nr:hypothetical protein E4U54_008791 [Claviceps lovelessii]
MAKSARSNTRKQNNRRLYAKVFSPAEAARNERLSAKLLELAKQPKPESSDINMDADDNAETEVDDEQGASDTAMDVDYKSSKSRSGKKTVDKRKQKKSGIVFKKYSDRVGAKRNKSTKRSATVGKEKEN